MNRAAALLLAALAGSGCTASTSWGTDRLLDLTDMVDVRYGTGAGLGVQLDATMLFGTGLGYSTVDRSRVWFGRHSVETLHTTFFGFVLGSGMGGPGYQFGDEFHPELVFDRPYLLAMANAGPGTNGSQFFIVTADACPWLDGKHTVFGRITTGMDIVDSISQLDRDARDRPRDDVTIQSVSVVEGA